MNKKILSFSSPNQKLVRVRLFIYKSVLAFIIFLLFVSGYQPVLAEFDCSNGNVLSLYQTEDVTLSGNLFVTGSVTIRNNVTLTLEAGTTVTMCGEYSITVSGGGNLIAIGTPVSPITIQANDPATNWGTLFFLNEANNSILQYVNLNDGGGNDPLAQNGTIQFINLTANSNPSPTLDHVTINNSGAFGMNLRVHSNDKTPPAINNITIQNSGRAAMLVNAQTLGGLGSNNQYLNNNPNTIQVVGGGESWVYHDQIWQDQGIPYEMFSGGEINVSASGSLEPYPELTILEGTTFLMHPGAELRIGTGSGRGATLKALGTAEDPIVFTRLNDVSGPWNQLTFNQYPDTSSELRYVNFSYGGSGGIAMINQSNAGGLTLDHVDTLGSSSTGLRAEGIVRIVDSVFEFHDTGLEFNYTSDAVIRNSIIRNNVTAGLISIDNVNYNTNCIDAIGNNWGSSDGPDDSHAPADACGNPKTNAGGGQTVSGGVLYEPWLPSGDPLQDRSIIQPEEFYVIANGVDETLVTITVRDTNGLPLVGKNVILNATVGTVIQPTQPTDSQGKTTASITSTATGFAYLSAFNLTDNAPFNGLGGITFWQGGGDAGGLISTNGAPFASPQLVLTGQPFQTGFPVSMRVPMTNSNLHPVEVNVTYGVSGLGIGAGFSEVYTTSKTLQPGESWDASGVWLPTKTGHQCIQASISATDQPTDFMQTFFTSIYTTQQNTNQNPCDPDNLNPYEAVPKKGGLLGVIKHFYNTYNLAKKTIKCLAEGISFNPLSIKANDTGRDYQQVFTPLVFDPPVIEDVELSPEQSSIINQMSDTSANLLSLNIAIGETAQRMNWAAQAVNAINVSSSSSLSNSMQSESDYYYLDLQYQAYRDFMNQYADHLETYASQIDTLLAVLGEDDDPIFLAEDYLNELEMLETTGFDAETLAYYQQSGLSDSVIEEIRQSLITKLKQQSHESRKYSDILLSIKASMLDLATRLRNQYPLPEAAPLSVSSTMATSQPNVFVPPQVFTFQVGHPLTGTQTVDLVVKPVNLPVNWTYELSQQSLLLDEGETIEVSLTLHPGGDLLQRDIVQLTVEGYVNGDLVGGILMEYLAPSFTPTQISGYQIFLPNVVR